MTQRKGAGRQHVDQPLTRSTKQPVDDAGRTRATARQPDTGTATPWLTTSTETTRRVDTILTGLGNHLIRAQNRSGFVVNALLVPYLLAAIPMFESTANRSDIDMVLGCAHPMGPLALCDLIGLDTVAAVADSMYEEFKEPFYAAPPLLQRMVASAGSPMPDSTGTPTPRLLPCDVRRGRPGARRVCPRTSASPPLVNGTTRGCTISAHYAAVPLRTRVRRPGMTIFNGAGQQGRRSGDPHGPA